MEKKKNNKKKKIDKEKVIRILKAIGYCIGFTLCAGAFVTLLVVGVRGCASTPRSTEITSTQTSNESSNQRIKRDNYVAGDYYKYYTYPYETGAYLIDYYYSENEPIGYYLNGDDVVYFNSFELARSDEFSDDGIIELKLDGVLFSYFDADSGDNIHFFDLSVGPNQLKSLYIGNSLRDELYNYNHTTRDKYNEIGGVLVLDSNYYIAFNNEINRYAPYKVNNDYFVNSTIKGQYILFDGLFKDSQNNYYTQVRATYIDGNGTRFGDAGINSVNSNTGLTQFMYLEYKKFTNSTNNWVSVNTQNFVTSTNSQSIGQVVMTKNSSWVNSIYQYITIIYDSGISNLPVGTSDNGIINLSSLNNSFNTETNAGGSIGGYSPFALIGSAFSSLLPLFNVYLWPGVTIGLLLVIPLISSIVLFIVWLFKR